MSKEVRIGQVTIGGGQPVAIQSMTNVDSRDEKNLIQQISSLTEAGCQIVRIAIPDKQSAETFGKVKKRLLKAGNHVPLVADVHFDYRLAIRAMEEGADKVRINPGNIGSPERLEAVVKVAKEREIPIRVGVNSGSLEKRLLVKYGGVTPEALAESALQNLRMIEAMDYDNLVVSIKASDVRMNYKAHKILAKETDYPIHIGLTESGTLKRGTVKSAIGIGVLLLEGIGDTMRVSLTADPIEEVYLANEILRSLGMKKSSVSLVSCPTCGRTKIQLEKLAEEVERKLAPVEKRLEEKGGNSIKVAVMGCVVNGPGEAREADFGIAGGDEKGLIFKKGKVIKTVDEEFLVNEFIKIIEDEI